MVILPVVSGILGDLYVQAPRLRHEKARFAAPRSNSRPSIGGEGTRTLATHHSSQLWTREVMRCHVGQHPAGVQLSRTVHLTILIFVLLFHDMNVLELRKETGCSLAYA